jgi:hypothetical protein
MKAQALSSPELCPLSFDDGLDGKEDRVDRTEDIPSKERIVPERDNQGRCRTLRTRKHIHLRFDGKKNIGANQRISTRFGGSRETIDN